MPSPGDSPQIPKIPGTLEPIPASQEAPAWFREIQQASDDPAWPPFPTLSQKAEASSVAVDGFSGNVDGEGHRRVAIRPREKSGVGESVGASPFSANEELTFQCPACFLTLRVPASQQNVDGPCPHCSAVISPPRVVKFGAARALPMPGSSIPGPRKEIYRPNREKAVTRFLKGEVRSLNGLSGDNRDGKD
jgi:hypothetical protein